MKKALAFAITFLFTLIGVLTPVILVTDTPSSTAQSSSVAAYEFEVLSGLQDEPGVTGGLFLTCGWHTGGCVGENYDTNPRSLDMDWSILSNPDAEVHAVFRHVRSEDSVDIHIAFKTSDSASCTGINAEVYIISPDESEKMVIGSIEYLHITDTARIIDTSATLSKGITKIRLGKLIDAEPNSNCPFTAPHLHQGDKFGQAVLNKSTVFGKGIPARRQFSTNLCISTSMWLMKIASTAPAVTATDTPTTVCPPTELKMIAGSSLDLQFVASRIVRLELYKADSSGEFCDADAASCTPKMTVDDATETPASFGAQPSGKYRARGRICVGSTCSVWSRSDTIDHIAPPAGLALKTSLAGQLGMHYTRSDVASGEWYKFVLYRADDHGNFCNPDDNACEPVATVLRSAGQGMPGETTKVPAMFGGQNEGKYYRARAQSCRLIIGRGGLVVDKCGGWSDLSDVILHTNSIGHVVVKAANGNLGASFVSSRAASFELYEADGEGNFCTPGANCDPVATATAPAWSPISTAPRFASFGSMDGGTYRVRARICDASSASGPAGAVMVCFRRQ